MLIYGIHACKNAVESERKVYKAYLLNGKRMPEWMKQYRVEIVDDFSGMLPKDAVHQGIALEIDDIQYFDINMLKTSPKNCTVAILDGVTDPHNMGAIIRSAACFGITAIIISDKSSCKITGTVAKSASGGLEHLPVILVTNLSQAIAKLKTFGFWIVSLSERGEKRIDEIDLTGKTCLVLGAEGAGIRRLQIKNSDFLAKLPTLPMFPTLNVSNSAAIAFYETAKQNDFNLTGSSK